MNMPEDPVKFYVPGAVAARLTHDGAANPEIVLSFETPSQPAKGHLVEEDFDDGVDIRDPKK